MSTYDEHLMIAIGAVRLAAEICTQVQDQLIDNDTLAKKDRSPVTIADFASQAVVCRLLEITFPDIPVVGEEGADALRGEDARTTRERVVDTVRSAMPDATEEQVLSWIDRGSHKGGETGRFWTLDPIDGTKGFLRKEQYAVALALIEDGDVVLGVLACPGMSIEGHSQPGLVMAAAKGQGTKVLPLRACGFVGAETVTTDGLTDTREARFCESVESGHSNQGTSASIAQALGITAEPVRMDSQAKYTAVACGQASIYLRLPTSSDYREKIWDHAAGMICVAEAGGTVTDIHGNTLDFTRGRKLEDNQGIIATNGKIHDSVVTAVGKALDG